jgi:hypothetical protein
MVEIWVEVVIVVWVQNSLVTMGWTLYGQGSIPPRKDCFIVITTTSLGELLPKLQNRLLNSRQMYNGHENKVAKCMIVVKSE